MFEKLKIKRIIFLIISVGCVVTFFRSTLSWCEYSNFFGLDTVIISGTNLLTDDQILSVSNLYKGNNIRKIDIQITQNNIEVIPYVKAALVSKVYPNKINIHINERIPIAYLNVDELFLIDQDNILLPMPEEVIINELPIISGFSDSTYNLILGKIVSVPKISEITNIVISSYTNLKALFMTISEIQYNRKKDELNLYNVDSGNPIFLGGKNYSTKMKVLAQFQNVIAGSRKLSDYKYLDLRWENQIIVKE